MSAGDPLLRRARADDFAALHKLLCHPDVCRYLSDGAPPAPERSRAWIAEAPVHAETHGGGLWLLAARDAQRLGAVRLSPAEGAELELTYLLHPDAWGAGLATRMAHTALGLAFASGPSPSVVAGADVPNAASIAVMQRLGMAFRRDVRYPMGEGVEYTITRDDFDLARIESLPVDDQEAEP